MRLEDEIEKLGESREGLRKCEACGEWSVPLRDGMCRNEECSEYSK